MVPHFAALNAGYELSLGEEVTGYLSS